MLVMQYAWFHGDGMPKGFTLKLLSGWWNHPVFWSGDGVPVSVSSTGMPLKRWQVLDGLGLRCYLLDAVCLYIMPWNLGV